MQGPSEPPTFDAPRTDPAEPLSASLGHRVAVGRILQVNFNAVANANAHERSRYLAVESPVAECRCFRETAFAFDDKEIEPDGFWLSCRSVAEDRSAHEKRRLRPAFAAQPSMLPETDLAYGESVVRNAAKIEEVSGFVARKTMSVFAPLPFTRGDFAY